MFNEFKQDSNREKKTKLQIIRSLLRKTEIILDLLIKNVIKNTKKKNSNYVKYAVKKILRKYKK